MDGVHVEGGEGCFNEWAEECSVNRGITRGNEERLLSKCYPPFLGNIERRSRNDGGWELISVFHNPHRKGRCPIPAVSVTLENLVGVPSKTAPSGKEEN